MKQEINLDEVINELKDILEHKNEEIERLKKENKRLENLAWLNQKQYLDLKDEYDNIKRKLEFIENK